MLLQFLQGIFYFSQTKEVFFSFAMGRACQYHEDASHLDSCTSSVCLSVFPGGQTPTTDKTKDREQQSRVMVPELPQLQG